MLEHKDILTLAGHTDRILWTGYSSDENMIGTVSDQTICIWNSASGHLMYKFDTDGLGQNLTGGFSADCQMLAVTCGLEFLMVYSMADGTILRHVRPPRELTGFMRTLRWSPDGQVLAIGTFNIFVPGVVFLYDVGNTKITQKRVLSTNLCAVEPEMAKNMVTFLECSAVEFVDEGRKLVVLTLGDGGIETYDLQKWEKWRFARPDYDPEYAGSVEVDADSPELTPQKREHGSHSMTVWQKDRILWIAGIDDKKVRIWNIPLDNESH
jgi:WD40 repeat protein